MNERREHSRLEKEMVTFKVFKCDIWLLSYFSLFPLIMGTWNGQVKLMKHDLNGMWVACAKKIWQWPYHIYYSIAKFYSW